MFKVIKVLLLVVLAATVSLVYIGCEQPNDVLTTVSKSKVTLNEEKLPTNPSGMLYELWIANETDSVSLGKFGYNNETRTYLNPDLTVRTDGGEFSINRDVNDFTKIFISVETSTGDDDSSPGSIMLIDYVASKTVKLTFPNIDSLWEGTARYSMESTSDGANNSATDGYSIWFAIYDQEQEDFNDTFLVGGILDWSLDSSDYVSCGSGNFIEANIIYGLENISQKDTSLIFGLDTLTHTVVRFDVVESTKVCDYYPTQLIINYNITGGQVIYDEFIQDNFALPDISQWGWKYKGWVVSKHLPTSAMGEMTKPGWIIFGDEMANTNGGLLSTGTFGQIDQPDDGNPYAMSGRVPPFPGEDFLVNLPGGMNQTLLVPSGFDPANGKVFISIEPINMVNDSTNFPLIAFIGDLPTDRSQVASNFTEQQFTLRGWMHSNDPYRGFPKVVAEIERF